MRPYPKIETLFGRDPDTHLVNPEDLRMPVVRSIGRWVVTEKIDGTNIRISYAKGDEKVRFGGRTDNALLHGDLIDYILSTFTKERFEECFKEDTQPGTGLTLYGEGYGAGIQKGGYYRPTKAVILFDAAFHVRPTVEGIENPLAGGPSGWWWQPDSVVTDLAEKFGVERVPILGEMNLDEIIDLVRVGIPSRVAPPDAHGYIHWAEGVVARPIEPLFDARGRRLIIKLKGGDFGQKTGPTGTAPTPLLPSN